VGDLKVMVRNHLELKPKYRVEDCYKVDSCWTRIAVHNRFENATLALVLLNSIWMWIDTDWNQSAALLEAHPVFFFAEQFFCFFFTLELMVRFMAFEYKRNCLKDHWFSFDLVLVSMMVLETWVLTSVLAITQGGGSAATGNASILKIGKMLRLLRMMRISRLMRSMPEFFILIKAISSASKATFFTLAFLFVVLYVYGIAFTQLLEGTEVGATYFNTVPVSMRSLFFYGTLTDNVADVANEIGDESIMVMLMFYTVILICAITLMNILIGVLCEAISAVAEKERMSLQVQLVEATLRSVLEAFDENHDGMVTKDEFVRVLESRDAVLALEDIGVDVEGLVDCADIIFEQNSTENDHDFDRALSFAEFMEVLLQLRGANKATVKDIVDLRKYFNKMLRNLDKLRVQVMSTHQELENMQYRSSQTLVT